MIQLNFYLDFTIHSTVQSTGVNITIKCAVSFNVRGNDHCNLQYTLLYTSHVNYTLLYINMTLTNLHCLVHCTNTLFCTVHYSPVFCTLHCMLTVHCTALCWLLSRQERPSSGHSLVAVRDGHLLGGEGQEMKEEGEEKGGGRTRGMVGKWRQDQGKDEEEGLRGDG